MSVSPQAKEIWDLIRENQKGLKEIREIQKQTSKQMKETGEKIKETRSLFETQWGKFMESLVEGDLINILNEQGIKVINTYPNIKHRSEKDQYEYDIVASNGKEMVVVEVKTTLRVKHVKYFLEDLKKFPVRIPIFKEKRIYGAIAYLKSEEKASVYAERKGLFVIRATGSSASLVNKKGFKPKVFS
ncbi:MAG: hypothetical protein GDA46_03505 [Bdellovibrionales bacterium]|nr:hypothetical protein [Bdellovibrionales bacterium]